MPEMITRVYIGNLINKKTTSIEYALLMIDKKDR